MTAKEFITELFERWEEGDSGPFFEALAPDVIWTAKGTTPISGTYIGREEYFEKCYGQLQSIFSGPTRCQVKRIVGEGDTVVVEWEGETPTVSGVLYTQDYCWVIRVSEDNNSIAEVTGYYDTERISALFTPQVL
jgi:ketosteroid isomerase-like protein